MHYIFRIKTRKLHFYLFFSLPFFPFSPHSLFLTRTLSHPLWPKTSSPAHHSSSLAPSLSIASTTNDQPCSVQPPASNRATSSFHWFSHPRLRKHQHRPFCTCKAISGHNHYLYCCQQPLTASHHRRSRRTTTFLSWTILSESLAIAFLLGREFFNRHHQLQSSAGTCKGRNK